MLSRLLENVIVQQLLDKVNVGQKHSSTAVSFHSKLIKSFSFSLSTLEQSKILFPLITHDFTAGEAADGDNHE